MCIERANNRWVRCAGRVRNMGFVQMQRNVFWDCQQKAMYSLLKCVWADRLYLTIELHFSPISAKHLPVHEIDIKHGLLFSSRHHVQLLIPVRQMVSVAPWPLLCLSSTMLTNHWRHLCWPQFERRLTPFFPWLCPSPSSTLP